MLQGPRGFCALLDDSLQQLSESTGMELEDMLGLPMPSGISMDGGLKVSVIEALPCPPLEKVLSDFRNSALMKLNACLQQQDTFPGGVRGCLEAANEWCQSVDQRLVPLAGKCWLAVPSLNENVADRFGGCLSMAENGEALYHCSGLFLKEYDVFQVQNDASRTPSLER